MEKKLRKIRKNTILFRYKDNEENLQKLEQAIIDFYNSKRRMPNFDEIGRMIGYSSRSRTGGARFVVDILLERGFMEKDPKASNKSFLPTWWFRKGEYNKEL